MNHVSANAIADRLNRLIAKGPEVAGDIYDLLCVQIVCSAQTDADPEIVTGYEEGSPGRRLRFLGLLNGIVAPDRIWAEVDEEHGRILRFGVTRAKSRPCIVLARGVPPEMATAMQEEINAACGDDAPKEPRPDPEVDWADLPPAFVEHHRAMMAAHGGKDQPTFTLESYAAERAASDLQMKTRTIPTPERHTERADSPTLERAASEITTRVMALCDEQIARVAARLRLTSEELARSCEIQAQEVPHPSDPNAPWHLGPRQRLAKITGEPLTGWVGAEFDPKTKMVTVYAELAP